MQTYASKRFIHFFVILKIHISSISQKDLMRTRGEFSLKKHQTLIRTCWLITYERSERN